MAHHFGRSYHLSCAYCEIYHEGISVAAVGEGAWLQHTFRDAPDDRERNQLKPSIEDADLSESKIRRREIHLSRLKRLAGREVFMKDVDDTKAGTMTTKPPNSSGGCSEEALGTKSYKFPSWIYP